MIQHILVVVLHVKLPAKKLVYVRTPLLIASWNCETGKSITFVRFRMTNEGTKVINNERTNNKSTTRLSCAKSSTCVAFVTLPQQRLNVITMSTNPLYANYQTLSPPAAGDPALDEGYERKMYFRFTFFSAVCLPYFNLYLPLQMSTL